MTDDLLRDLDYRADREAEANSDMGGDGKPKNTLPGKAAAQIRAYGEQIAALEKENLALRNVGLEFERQRDQWKAADLKSSQDCWAAVDQVEKLKSHIKDAHEMLSQYDGVASAETILAAALAETAPKGGDASASGEPGQEQPVDIASPEPDAEAGRAIEIEKSPAWPVGDSATGDMKSAGRSNLGQTIRRYDEAVKSGNMAAASNRRKPTAKPAAEVWRGEGMPSICPDEEAEEIADRIVEPTAKPAACTTCGGTGEITESVKDDWSSQGLIHIKPCPDCCPGAEGG